MWTIEPDMDLPKNIHDCCKLYTINGPNVSYGIDIKEYISPQYETMPYAGALKAQACVKINHENIITPVSLSKFSYSMFENGHPIKIVKARVELPRRRLTLIESSGRHRGCIFLYNAPKGFRMPYHIYERTLSESYKLAFNPNPGGGMIVMLPDPEMFVINHFWPDSPELRASFFFKWDGVYLSSLDKFNTTSTINPFCEKLDDIVDAFLDIRRMLKI